RYGAGAQPRGIAGAHRRAAPRALGSRVKTGLISEIAGQKGRHPFEGIAPRREIRSDIRLRSWRALYRQQLQRGVRRIESVMGAGVELQVDLRTPRNCTLHEALARRGLRPSIASALQQQQRYLVRPSRDLFVIAA